MQGTKVIGMKTFLEKVFPSIGWDYQKLLEQLRIPADDGKDFTIHVRYATIVIPLAEVKKYLATAKDVGEEKDELDEFLEVQPEPRKEEPVTPGPLKKEEIVAKYSKPVDVLKPVKSESTAKSSKSKK